MTTIETRDFEPQLPGVTFPLLHPPLSFTIPREWWETSGANRFVRSSGQKCYVWHRRDGARVVPLRLIWPMIRDAGTHWRSYGFRNGPLPGERKDGLLEVLQAMIAGEALEPVPAVLSSNDPRYPAAADETRLQLLDGFHRFYASHALGFPELPCVVKQ